MNAHSSDVEKIKHFLLGAGLSLVVTFTASSVFAQSLPVSLQGGLMPCGSLGNKMVTPAECDAADAAAGISHTQTPPNPPCAAGQVPTNELPCMPQFGAQQGGFQQPGGNQSQSIPNIDDITGERDSIEQALASGRLQVGRKVGCISVGGQSIPVEDCLQAAKDAIASGGNFSMPQNQQFNQQQNQNFQQNFQPTQQNQQSLFGQQQFSQEQKEQPNVNLVKPISKISTNLKRKGIALADKLSSTLSKKFKSAKTENKRLAAVKSIAKQLSKVWKYVESAYGEIDEDIFDFDSSVADIADALKSRDPDLAFEITQDVLESIKQILEQ